MRFETKYALTMAGIVLSMIFIMAALYVASIEAIYALEKKEAPIHPCPYCGVCSKELPLDKNAEQLSIPDPESLLGRFSASIPGDAFEDWGERGGIAGLIELTDNEAGSQYLVFSREGSGQIIPGSEEKGIVDEILP